MTVLAVSGSNIALAGCRMKLEMRANMDMDIFFKWDAVQKFNGKTGICFISKVGFGIGLLHTGL